MCVTCQMHISSLAHNHSFGKSLLLIPQILLRNPETELVPVCRFPHTDGKREDSQFVLLPDLHELCADPFGLEATVAAAVTVAPFLTPFWQFRTPRVNRIIDATKMIASSSILEDFLVPALVSFPTFRYAV